MRTAGPTGRLRTMAVILFTFRAVEIALALGSAAVVAHALRR